MNASIEMPKYQSHKTVWALKIEEVGEHVPKEGDTFNGSALFPVDKRYGPILVDAEWVEKHKPEAGGYYVVYKDGYKSYSPAQAFEEGYTLIK